MKIRKLINVLAVCLISGLGLFNVQPTLGQIPPALFQYAIFYNGLLEFSDCATMTINGRVNCNSNIFIGTPSSSTLTFNGFVTAAGLITNPPNVGMAQSSWTGITTYNGTPSPGWGTGEPAINLPFGPGSYAEMIKLPAAGEATNSPISQFRYYNKAGLVILVTNITTALNGTNVTNVLTSVILKSGMYDPAPLVFSYTNNLPTNTSVLYSNWLGMTTNWARFGASNWLTTNSTFYDAREGRTNHVTQIDIGKFGTWIATNTNVLAKWLGPTSFNGIIYVGDFRTTNSMFMNAVRLTNGQTIPSMGIYYTIPGLTVATINPLYIQGLYNCPGTTNVSSTNTSGTQPCSVACDALTILSTGWNDGPSFAEPSSGTPPNANTTTVNTAIIAGNVPSTGTSVSTYSGGVQNLPRLLENWGGNTLWLNTSLVNLYPSAQATKQFQEPPLYYSAPTRRFSFDPNFNNIYAEPPGTPFFSPPQALMILLGLNQSYDGTPRSVGVLTVPSRLNVTLTYNGSSNAPTNVGNYQVIATVNDPVYIGSVTDTLVVSNGLATVAISNLSQVFDGTPKYISCSTIPFGLPVNVTYNGHVTPPAAPGTYSVIATVNTSNYMGGSIASLVIAKAPTTVLVSNLSQIYDGTAKAISVATVPPDLTVDLTYNGSTDAPTNAGSYTVVGIVDDLDYAGGATNTLVITQRTPAPTPIILSGLASAVDGSFQINFTNTPGLSFSVLSSADFSEPLTDWNFAGSVVEVAPGQYQFIDPQATNNPQQFYMIRSP